MQLSTCFCINCLATEKFSWLLYLLLYVLQHCVVLAKHEQHFSLLVLFVIWVVLGNLNEGEGKIQITRLLIVLIYSLK